MSPRILEPSDVVFAPRFDHSGIIGVFASPEMFTAVVCGPDLRSAFSRRNATAATSCLIGGIISRSPPRTRHLRPSLCEEWAPPSVFGSPECHPSLPRSLVTGRACGSTHAGNHTDWKSVPHRPTRGLSGYAPREAGLVRRGRTCLACLQHREGGRSTGVFAAPSRSRFGF